MSALESYQSLDLSNNQREPNRMKINLLQVIITTSILHLSVSVTRYTGKFSVKDYELNVGLEGHLIKTTKAQNALECFSECVVDCRCKSYQINDTANRCELLSETKTSVASSFKSKPGYKYFELKQNIKQESNDRRCSNGCCSLGSCLNGGRCTELCNHVNLKFSCECQSGFGGHYCQIPPSCDKIPKGSPSGVYTVMNPNSNSFLRVYCDFTSEPRFVWTLIESFKFAQSIRQQYLTKPFSVNFPRTETTIDWNDYRMPLSNMEHIETHSTHWRATCKFDSEGLKYDDYLRVKKASLRLLPDIPEQCVRYEYLSARNISCKNCTGYITSGGGYHVFADSIRGQVMTPPCEWDASDGVVRETNNWGNGEELFGNYDVYNSRHRCSSSDAATTNWWLGKRVRDII